VQLTVCGTQSPKPSNIPAQARGWRPTLRCRTLNSRAHMRSEPVRSEAPLASSRKARVYVVALSKPGVVNHA
jgi:methylphosphotriester-DNA--protein-cysteine methyltransferase